MKRRYQAGIIMMLISAMIASNLPMTTVFAAAKKQQVKQETKKLEEQSRKMQQEIKDLDEKMIKSNDAYEACQEKLISVQKQLKKTQQELKEAKASKEDQSRIMSKRIKFLYENGNMAYMEVIFEANNFQEFLKRADYVSKISKYDSNMFLQLQTTEDKIRMATKSLKQDYQNTKTLTAKAKTEKEKLAFVGDGINDAPVLSRADIGIAMGALGSDAAIEAADIVLMDDDPLKISKAIHISRKCIHIVYENIYFAIGIKVLFLLLGAIGIANMWMAIFADVGVMILAVLNAIRALFVKNL